MEHYTPLQNGYGGGNHFCLCFENRLSKKFCRLGLTQRIKKSLLGPVANVGKTRHEMTWVVNNTNSCNQGKLHLLTRLSTATECASYEQRGIGAELAQRVHGSRLDRNPVGLADQPKKKALSVDLAWNLQLLVANQRVLRLDDLKRHSPNHIQSACKSFSFPIESYWDISKSYSSRGC